jgi:hypothetical protein
MAATTIGSEIKDPNQKFIYQYDFAKNWTFLIELINVSKEENGKLDYPALIKSEGIAPSQYGTKGLVGDKLAEVEMKYDLGKGVEGYGVVGEQGEEEFEDNSSDSESEEGQEESGDEII